MKNKAWVLKALIQKSLLYIPMGYKVNTSLINARGKHNVESIQRRIEGLSQFLARVDEGGPIRGLRVLEYGTGWGAVNALLMGLMGAKEVVATDYLPHLELSVLKNHLEAIANEAEIVEEYLGLSAQVTRERIKAILDGEHTMEEMLAELNIQYLAPFDSLDSAYENGVFDMTFSYGVKAHFPLDIIYDAAAEEVRLLKPGGRAVHFIGLQDPYTAENGRNPTNFLKYSKKRWQLINARTVQNNNRLRGVQHREIYEKLGGKVLLYDPHVPDYALESTKGLKVDEAFEGCSREELAAVRAQLILQFND